MSNNQVSEEVIVGLCFKSLLINSQSCHLQERIKRWTGGSWTTHGLSPRSTLRTQSVDYPMGHPIFCLNV